MSPNAPSPAAIARTKVNGLLPRVSSFPLIEMLRRRTQTRVLFGILASAFLAEGTVASEITIRSNDGSSQDCSVLSSQPDTNKDGYGLWVGSRADWGSAVAQCYVKLDLSALPAGATVTQATFYIYAKSYSGTGTDTNTMRLYRATSSWSEPTITWNNQPSIDSTSLGSASFPHLGWYQFDVTSTVAQWASGGNNYGFSLRAVDVGGSLIDLMQCANEHLGDPSEYPKLVITYTAATLPAPVLVAPPNGSTYTSGRRPTFQWQAVTGATRYHIQIDDNAGFGSPEFDVPDLTGTSWAPPSDLSLTKYYWHVRAGDASQYYNWSDRWEVTIAVILLPPTLTGPANGSTVSTLRPTFQWQAVTGASRYHLQVDNNSDFSSPEWDNPGVVATSSTPNFDLLNNTTYYWRVRSGDTIQYYDWSSAWRFTIGIAQPSLAVTPSDRPVIADSGTATFDASNAGSGTLSWSAQVTEGWSWLSITSGSSGTNVGTINASYTANSGSTSRVGKITVTASGANGSPKVVTVTQAGTGPLLKVAPDNRDVGPDAGTATFDVSNAGGGMLSWSAQVTEGGSWLSITSGSSGSNSGMVTLSIAANGGTATRTGSITVTAPGAVGSPKVVKVTQAASVYYTLTLNVNGEARKHVLIDMDPSFQAGCDVDDILALIYAAQSPYCDLIGITIGWGNMWDGWLCPGQQIPGHEGPPPMSRYYDDALGARNVLMNSHALPGYDADDIQIPIKTGARFEDTWQQLHIDPHAPPSSWTTSPPINDASSFIDATVKNNPQRVTIIAQGTLTNLATAMHHYEGGPIAFMRDVGAIWITGGGLTRGNVLASLLKSEYNIWRDSAAAEYVFMNVGDQANVRMAPLDVTMDAPITRAEWKSEVMPAAQGGTNPIPEYIGQKVLTWIDTLPQNLSSTVLCAMNPVACPIISLFLADFLNQMYPFDTIGVALALGECGSVISSRHKISVNCTTCVMPSVVHCVPGVTAADDSAADYRGAVTIYEDFDVPLFKMAFFDRMRAGPREPLWPIEHVLQSPRGGLYPAGKMVTLIAAPKPGWRVKGWRGTDDDSSTSLTNTVTMTSSKTVTVEFVEQQPEITAESASGSIEFNGFADEPSAAPAPTGVTVSNPTTSSVDWQASVDQEWVALTLADSAAKHVAQKRPLGEPNLTGTLQAGAAVILQVNVDLAGFDPGTYNATLTVKAGDTEKELPVIAVVQPARTPPEEEQTGAPRPVGFCGAGSAGMIPLILLGLVCMKLTTARWQFGSVLYRCRRTHDDGNHDV